MIRQVTPLATALLICGACTTPAAPAANAAPPTAAAESKHEMAAPVAMEMEHRTVEQKGDAPRAFDQRPLSGTRARCAVTDELFTVWSETPVSVYQGRTYVFCCASCKPRFDAAPEKYARR